MHYLLNFIISPTALNQRFHQNGAVVCGLRPGPLLRSQMTTNKEVQNSIYAIETMLLFACGGPL